MVLVIGCIKGRVLCWLVWMVLWCVWWLCTITDVPELGEWMVSQALQLIEHTGR
jgi:hypothetical protein